MTIDTVIRIASEDLDPSDSVYLSNGIQGSEVFFDLVFTQSNYNITDASKLTISISDVESEIYLSPGFYSPSALAFSIGTQLDLIVAGFTVFIDSLTRRMTISCPNAFNILTAKSSEALLRLMGFDPNGSYESQMVYTGPNIATSYIGIGMFLSIEGINFETDITTSSASIIRGPIIVPWSAFGSIENYSPGYPIKYKIYFSKPLKGFKVSFHDLLGRKIDFNGGPWILNIYVTQ
jgi:hypothetical protein